MKSDVLAVWRETVRSNTALQEVLREIKKEEPAAFDPKKDRNNEQTALAAAYAQGWRDCFNRFMGLSQQDARDMNDNPFIDFSQTDAEREEEIRNKK